MQCMHAQCLPKATPYHIYVLLVQGTFVLHELQAPLVPSQRPGGRDDIVIPTLAHEIGPMIGSACRDDSVDRYGP